MSPDHAGCHLSPSPCQPTHPCKVADIELIASAAARVVRLEVVAGVRLATAAAAGAAVAALRRGLVGVGAVSRVGGDHVIVQIGVTEILPPAGAAIDTRQQRQRRPSTLMNGGAEGYTVWRGYWEAMAIFTWAYGQASRCAEHWTE